ncbi:MAG TPA: hypothetical protein PKH22_12935, partial [Leptospiraceae bacterium]|nr:hypothetical protein [Leptospiraceae bacterium]
MYFNGIDLKKQILEYVKTTDSVAIYVPYIKEKELREILGQTKNCRYVVVRWEPKDILERASDLEIYYVCKERNIPLYRNSRLHLKLYLGEDNALLTTANISARAMNDGKNDNYNYELGTKIDKLDFEDRLYLQTIVDKSLLLSDEIIEEIKEQLAKLPINEEGIDFEFKNKTENKDFLLSSLPMTESIEKLRKFYQWKDAPTKEEYECLIHDLSLYEIPAGLAEYDFINELKNKFFSHPFVKAFIDEIRSSGGELFFGRVRQWLAANCANSPT